MKLNDTQDQNYSYPENPILFRFCFIFILTFILLANNGTFFFLQHLLVLIRPFLIDLIRTFGKTFFDLSSNASYINGSGDTAMQWIQLLLILIFSAVGTLIWSLLDRKNKSYPRLYYWLTVMVRYYIAFMLLNYGMVKLTHSQFPFPTLLRLTEPLYKFSPMGLAWTFYGASNPYNIFMGIAEVMGILLLFRKTTTLGAIITFAVSVNIMATNYFFDVPVKLVSTALALLSLFLLAPNIQRLMGLLIAQKTVKLIPLPAPIYNKRWKKITMISIKVLLLLLVFSGHIRQLISPIDYFKPYFDPEAELYGAYYIPNREYKNRAKNNIPDEWHQLIITTEKTLNIRNEEMDVIRYEYIKDPKKKEIKIIDSDKSVVLEMKYHLENTGITLRNIHSPDSTSIFLEKIDMDNIDLKTRTFRWINEYPHNR